MFGLVFHQCHGVRTKDFQSFNFVALRHIKGEVLLLEITFQRDFVFNPESAGKIEMPEPGLFVHHQ